MADVFTREKRSAVMARIRATDTKPEMAVRRALHRLGYRYRVHDRSLPGRPDVVLRRHATVVQVKGCFWHGHRCLKGRTPGTNAAYWVPKIDGNKRRDRRNERRLRALGWRVVAVWECRVRRLDDDGLRRLAAAIMDSQRHRRYAKRMEAKGGPASRGLGHRS